jgi:hypothetical protein
MDSLPIFSQKVSVFSWSCNLLLSSIAGIGSSAFAGIESSAALLLESIRSCWFDLSKSELLRLLDKLDVWQSIRSSQPSNLTEAEAETENEVEVEAKAGAETGTDAEATAEAEAEAEAGAETEAEAETENEAEVEAVPCLFKIRFGCGEIVYSPSQTCVFILGIELLIW